MATGTDLDQGKGRRPGMSTRVGGRWRQLSLPSRQQQITVLLVLLALLPALMALPGLFGKPYAPGTDEILLELGARRVTHAVVELGPYSRNGWFHPGPTIYYLLAGPYLLTGRSSVGILFAALIINATAITLIVVTVRRQAGLLAALGSLAVLLLVLRAMPAKILADPWNPYLPILILLLMIVLAWRAVAGRHQLLPALPVLASVCVQTHIGFLLPCIAVLAVTVVLLVLRRKRPRIGMRRWVPWLGVLVLMWLPPIWQQLTGRQGNLAAIWHYFREGQKTQSWSATLHVVETELGRLPAYILDIHARPNFVLPPVLPLWTTFVTIAAFVGIVVLAVLRRERIVIELAILTVAVSLSALVAVKQVTGFLFEYVVQWASLSGALAWMTVAIGVATFLHRSSARDDSSMRFAGRSAVALGALCALVAAAVGVPLGLAAGRTRPQNEPDAPPVATQVRHWLAGRPPGVVGIRYLPCLRPSFLCIGPAGHAVIGQLVLHGVPTRSLDFDSWYFRPVVSGGQAPVTYPMLLGFTRGDSPIPPAPWHQVARSGHLVVYSRG